MTMGKGFIDNYTNFDERGRVYRNLGRKKK